MLLWQKCEIRSAVIFICFFYLKQKKRQVCWLSCSCSWVKSADQLSRWQVWRRQNLVKGSLPCPGHGNAHAALSEVGEGWVGGHHDGSSLCSAIAVRQTETSDPWKTHWFLINASYKYHPPFSLSLAWERVSIVNKCSYTVVQSARVCQCPWWLEISSTR